MQKLIKVSDHYYVVDDKAEIKQGDLMVYDEIRLERHFNWKDKSNCNKIIATTNKSKLLSHLPQITNVSDELVDKEVEVTFRCSEGEKGCRGLCDLCTEKCDYVAIIKPISKETTFNPCSKCKYMYTECIERQRKYNATSNNECFVPKETKSTNPNLLCQNCNVEAIPSKGYVNYHNIQANDEMEFENKLLDCLKCPKCGHSWIPCSESIKETSTNETLEEVAEEYVKDNSNQADEKYDLTKSSGIIIFAEECFIAGYKHAENKMYSENEVEELLIKATSRSYPTIQDVRNWFQNNKK